MMMSNLGHVPEVEGVVRLGWCGLQAVQHCIVYCNASPHNALCQATNTLLERTQKVRKYSGEDQLH